MKKAILFLGLLCLTLVVNAQQQTKTVTITKVKKGEEPKEVMNAIKNDFPDAIVNDLSFLPAKLYGREWNVDVQGNQLDNVDFYQVQVTEPGKEVYTAVYDKSGKLLSSREVIRHAALPAAVSESLKKFKDWHVDNTAQKIKYHGSKVSEVFRVKMQKKAEHKIIYLDPEGNIINTRISLV